VNPELDAVRRRLDELATAPPTRGIAPLAGGVLGLGGAVIVLVAGAAVAATVDSPAVAVVVALVLAVPLAAAGALGVRRWLRGSPAAERTRLLARHAQLTGQAPPPPARPARVPRIVGTVTAALIVLALVATALLTFL
jgi:hypothetical protein